MWGPSIWRSSHAAPADAWQGGRLVTGLVMGDGPDQVTGVVAKTQSGAEEVYEADAVIFAISISGEIMGEHL